MPDHMHYHARPQAHLLQPPHMLRTPNEARNLNALSRGDSIQCNQLVAMYVVNQGRWRTSVHPQSRGGEDEIRSQQVL